VYLWLREPEKAREHERERAAESGRKRERKNVCAPEKERQS